MDGNHLHAAVHQAPPQEGDLIGVLAAVIHQEDRYLVCRRPLHKRHGGYWEFPGGKLELGESLLEAAHRELSEELGVEVLSIGEVLFSCQDPGSRFLIEFAEVQICGVPEAREHDEIRWLTASELRALKLAPSDHAFAVKLET
jgi:8-oxo-dGTP diphosphatase